MASGGASLDRPAPPPGLSGVSAALWLRRGQRALSRGEVAKAALFCARAAALRPRWHAPHLWSALARCDLDDLQGALAALDIASTLRPASAVPQLFRGRSLLDHGRFDEAVQALEAARALDPTNLHVQGHLAVATWALKGGGLDPAWLSPAFAGGAGLWGRWVLLIEERFPGGPGTDYPAEPDEARTTFERLARWRARRACRAAARSRDAGAIRRAKAALERSVALWPADEACDELRVSVHLTSARLLGERITADPSDVDAHLEAAEDHLETGAPKDALESLCPVSNLIESIDRTRLSWHSRLAVLMARAHLAMGQPEEARPLLARARSLMPLDVEPAYYQGVALLLLGKRVSARRALVDACGLEPSLGPTRLQEFSAATCPDRSAF